MSSLSAPRPISSLLRASGGSASTATDVEVVEFVLPPAGGLGYLAQALWEQVVDIQKGRVERKVWNVPSL